ncbi:hypothetical protein PRIPAC_97388, partial [Pristionchus pacificus]|uniref:Uncharacterized protein n=1 Tax=Pristionchus pacificus TaxID=54126 RepID=A0A2A6BCA9_PRIPA
NLHVVTNNGEVVNEMTFDPDLISVNHICEIAVRKTAAKIRRCTKITVQKVKERYLKLRVRDWMGIWDIDDLPHHSLDHTFLVQSNTSLPVFSFVKCAQS